MENERGIHTTIEAFGGLFWVFVFLTMFFTGNCEMCGGDRDYVGEYTDREG